MLYYDYQGSKKQEGQKKTTSITQICELCLTIMRLWQPYLIVWHDGGSPSPFSAKWGWEFCLQWLYSCVDAPPPNTPTHLCSCWNVFPVFEVSGADSGSITGYCAVCVCALLELFWPWDLWFFDNQDQWAIGKTSDENQTMYKVCFV